MAPKTTQTDDLTALLRDAADKLGQAATDRERREALLKEAEAALAKIPMGAAPELADSPVVQALTRALGVSDLRPGEVRNPGTLAERERQMTYQDLCREHKPVTFIPLYTGIVEVNGTGQVLLEQGAEITVPLPVYDRYKEILQARRQADVNEKWLLDQSDQEPDPAYKSDASARVRVWSTQGKARGLRSGFLSFGVPSAEEWAGEGEEG